MYIHMILYSVLRTLHKPIYYYHYYAHAGPDSLPTAVGPPAGRLTGVLRAGRWVYRVRQRMSIYHYSRAHGYVHTEYGYILYSTLYIYIYIYGIFCIIADTEHVVYVYIIEVPTVCVRRM